MKKPNKFLKAVIKVYLLTNVLLLIRCGWIAVKNPQADIQMDYEIPEVQFVEDSLAKKLRLAEKVQAAGGISEEEAIKIAKEAMKTDMGENAKNMKLYVDEYGCGANLRDVTKYAEYQDRGEMAYFIRFDDIKEKMNLTYIYSYHCVVDAMDGSVWDVYKYVPGKNRDIPVSYKR